MKSISPVLLASLFVGVAAASLGAVPAAAQAVNLPIQTISGTRLDVSARGAVKRVPDVASISAGVVTQSATADVAMRDNATKMSAVIAALKKAGIADRDVATATLSLNPQYRYAENQPPVITGYQASNSVTIRFRDLAKAGTILDALVRQGANQINGPALSIDKPEAALDEARQAAIKDARARAELYAAAAGLRVKRILTISESADYGAPVPMYAARAMKAEAADTQVVPGEQDVSVVVNVSFELE